LGKNLLIVATLDTKGREASYVKDCVRKLGITPLVMDVGTLGDPLEAPDITRTELAELAGYHLDQFIKKKDRAGAVKAMQEGGSIVARRLLEDGKIDGAFGMGGGTGTAIVTHIMRSLPFGLPKVVVSTVASRNMREYVDTKDIVMFHSVADLLGFNEFIRLILGQASHAVCGMMERGSTINRDKPLVAVTAYGISSNCAILAEPLLQERGYEMIGFHANGCGGMAMEEFIGEGLVAGVLDLTPHEIADEIFGGYCKGIGSSRLETAGRMDVPLVFAPGGLDNAVFSPFYPMPDQFRGRRRHDHDTRFCVRMGPEEMKEFAEIIGEKLNRSSGPTYVLIPKKGWSEVDKAGVELFDPEVDQIFVDHLRGILNPKIPIEEMDAHISEPTFALRAVEVLDQMIRSSSNYSIYKKARRMRG
jgi:uncharacterized protein (UPF0261 family)